MPCGGILDGTSKRAPGVSWSVNPRGSRACRRGTILLCVLCAVAWIGTAAAEKVKPADSIAADLEIDRALGALRAPVLREIPYPGTAEKGAPLWPLYKQEIAKGQTDFRPAAAPVETERRRERAPAPKPKPKLPIPPPNPNPNPQPQPCTPNSPNWPNCLQQP